MIQYTFVHQSAFIVLATALLWTVQELPKPQKVKVRVKQKTADNDDK